MGAVVDPDLRSTLAAAPLRRDAVLVGGEGAVAFLQGQLSQDVEGLSVGQSAPSLLLQPTGKVDAWLRVSRLGPDEVLLDVDEGWGPSVAARLRRFLLRTKAEITEASWSGLAVRGPGAVAAAGETVEGVVALAVAWPEVEGVDLLGPSGATSSLPTASAAALDALRIECGVPAMGAEVTERTIPAELGRWAVDVSVSFTKGCYTGQELVARVDSRGGLGPRPVQGLVISGDVVPEIGADVVADGEAVGQLTSAARSPVLGPIALAPLPRAVAPDREVHVAVADGLVAATVTELPLR